MGTGAGPPYWLNCRVSRALSRPDVVSTYSSPSAKSSWASVAARAPVVPQKVSFVKNATASAVTGQGRQVSAPRSRPSTLPLK